jgi:hypothetical protein
LIVSRRFHLYKIYVDFAAAGTVTNVGRFVMFVFITYHTRHSGFALKVSFAHIQ